MLEIVETICISCWIKSLDNQLATSLLPTCSTLVIIKPEQVVRTRLQDNEPAADLMQLNSQKRASCNTFVDILQQTCYQQADVRMRLHGLRQRVGDKSAASCQQTCYGLIVKTCYPQACYKLFQ